MKLKLLFPLLFIFAQLSLAQVNFTSDSNLVNTSHTDRCIVDMNSDGLDDVVSVTTTIIQVFFQQEDGSFLEKNYSTSAADNFPSWSLAAGDYNRDGFTDLVYGGGSGVTFMRSQDNGGGIDDLTFIEDSFPQYVFSQRSNFVDINNDGNLDVFVCHDVEPNVFYINDGAGNLSYNQGSLGDYPTGGNYGSVWIDYDNDRDIDMFISKCGGEPARRNNEMHRNNGDGTYSEVAASLGLEDDMQTWSSAWADYDNDGDMDVWIGASSIGDGFHRLMKNNDGTFIDVISGSGLESLNTTSIENQTYDFDNDGNADIVIGGKILYGNGDLTFTISNNDINAQIFGDLNNDGFIDGFVSGVSRINTGNNNNWIKFMTIGVQSNIHGIGARVEIETSSGTQIRDIRSGEGFGNMSSLNAHFGIGQDQEVQSATVYWPSGAIDVYENLEINKMHQLREGEGVLDIADVIVNNLILYPNPAKSVLHINEVNPIEEPLYTIFDVKGQRVMHGRLQTSIIDISSLNKGTYLLRVFDKKYSTLSTQAQKFIKI